MSREYRLLFHEQRKRGPDKKVQIGEKCRICKEQATGFNYGALTCNPCKSFFRRTILENNLTQSCDRGSTCKRMQIRRCIGCRLRMCLDVGMNQDYIRQLRIRSMQRRIDKIPKCNQLLKFSETLDPSQENLMAILQGFWLIYRGTPTLEQEARITTHELSMKNTVSDVIDDFAAKMSKLKVPNNNFTIPLDGIDFLKDYMEIHVNIIAIFLEAIPNIRWNQLQESTKQQLVGYVSMEVPLIRGGSRYLYGVAAPDDFLKKTGVSQQLIAQMYELIGRFIQMEPDCYETCLLVALCATSPDRGLQNVTDYKILSNIQETILEILRIKLKIDGKPLRCLASHISYLQSLRSYSNESENEWHKYATHKKKIVTMQEMGREKDRDGLSYLIRDYGARRNSGYTSPRIAAPPI